jgi:DeoR/GlpR family transcriptional regulator of sugar metabolism
VLSIQRREAIKSILLEKKSVTVTEIAERFEVSTETVRRDFKILMGDGYLEKTYGGAVLTMQVSYTASEQMKSGIMVEIKRRLAKKAVEFICPHDSIFLDHSTTVFELCKEIENIPLTVMTNSLSVMNCLAGNPQIKLVVLGGNFDIKNHALFGMEAVDFLERHYLDKVFFSCRAVNMLQGLSDSDEQVAALRRMIISRGEKKILIADHSKFGQSSFLSIADLGQIDYCITDEKLNETWHSFFGDKGVNIIECVEPVQDDVIIRA